MKMFYSPELHSLKHEFFTCVEVDIGVMDLVCMYRSAEALEFLRTHENCSLADSMRTVREIRDARPFRPSVVEIDKEYFTVVDFYWDPRYHEWILVWRDDDGKHFYGYYSEAEHSFMTRIDNRKVNTAV